MKESVVFLDYWRDKYKEMLGEGVSKMAINMKRKSLRGQIRALIDMERKNV